jgi:hypothetical protein
MNGIARIMIVAGLVLSGIGVAQAQNHHYKDNGDGTVSDADTGLTWEKKTGTIGDDTVPFCRRADDCPDVHNVGNRYQWNNQRVRGGKAPDGSAFINFIARLNGDVSGDGRTITGCFANHCDWRLPNIDELETIVDHNVPRNTAMIDTIFGPTELNTYWSATTERERPDFAWGIYFRDGRSDPYLKAGYFFVRAVRGGSQ